jgi:P4 family phage/plasmid primase-like protien
VDGGVPERRYTPADVWTVRSVRGVWGRAKGDGGGPVIGEEPACLDGHGPDHPRMRAYFAARGVPLDLLPDGRLPASLRYCGAVADTITDEAGAHTEVRHPAVLCEVTYDGRHLIGLHRIYLDPGGEPRKRADGPWGEAKKARGPIGGGAVRLSPIDRGNGVLLLCEGIETGLALAAATGYGVWACVSANGLQTLALRPADVDRLTGRVKRIIIAGDTDRSGTGQRAARAAAAAIAEAHPHLAVCIALPSLDVAPELFEPRTFEDDEPKPRGQAKSVDWLDIVADERYGVDAVREALRRAVEDVPIGGSYAAEAEIEGRREALMAAQGGGGGRMLDGPLPRARQLLMTTPWLAPNAGRRTGPDGRELTWARERWSVVYWRGDWYIYTQAPDGAMVYQRIDEQVLRSRVLAVMQEMTDGDGAPLNPEPKHAQAVLEAMINEAAYTGEQTPVWLPPSCDDRGWPVWGRSVAYGADDDVWAGGQVIVFRDVLFAADRWAASRTIVTRSHSSRWFGLHAMPYRFPRELHALAAIADEEQYASALYTLLGQLCPTWLRFIEEIAPDEPAWLETLQRYFGLCLTQDMSYEKILLTPGAPGSGKGTLITGLEAALGPGGVASIAMSQLGESFGLAPLVGRNVALMTDAGMGRHTDPHMVLENLKRISGGDTVAIRDLYKSWQPNVRLGCKIWIATNDLPTLPDSSGALDRRLLVLPMYRVAAEKPDPTLKAKIRGEGLGIMLWALEGLRRLRAAGGFEPPEDGVRLMSELQRTQAPVRAFVADSCVIQDGGEEQTDLVYAAYMLWCDGEGIGSPMTKAVFGKALKAAHGIERLQRERSGVRYSVYSRLRVNAEVRSAIAADPDLRRRARLDEVDYTLHA